MDTGERRSIWLRAAELFDSIGTWMTNETAQLEELEDITRELRELGMPPGWIAVAIIEARDYRYAHAEGILIDLNGPPVMPPEEDR